MPIVIELPSHIQPLTNILWKTRPGIKMFYVGLVQDMDILVEAPSEIQKDFLAPDFYLNYFFCLYFFLLFNKRILLLILLTQTQQFRVLFVVEELYLSKTLYLRGKASQLAMLTFNYPSITRLVALKCGPLGSWWNLWHEIAFGRPQPTSVLCINWWTWREWTAPCKSAGHMAA